LERNQLVKSDWWAPGMSARIMRGHCAACHLSKSWELPTSTRKRAAALAAQFQIPNVYPSLQAMAEAQPKVIHILTPPGSHAALALEALEMGCHVFVEKPMAESVADCDRMIRERPRKGPGPVGESFRPHGSDRSRSAGHDSQGRCGEVQAVDFFRSSDYQAYSGGPPSRPISATARTRFRTWASTVFTCWRHFWGPSSHADTRYYASGIGDPNLVFDEWRTLVETDRGTGQMYISWNVRPIQNELVIHGTKGVMHVDCYLQVITLRKTYPAPKAVQRILGSGFQFAAHAGQRSRSIRCASPPEN
jgi:predicted dehydrogenase